MSLARSLCVLVVFGASCGEWFLADSRLRRRERSVAEGVLGRRGDHRFYRDETRLRVDSWVFLLRSRDGPLNHTKRRRGSTWFVWIRGSLFCRAVKYNPRNRTKSRPKHRAKKTRS